MKMKKWYIIISCGIACGCSVSITMMHTEGSASGVVDETHNANAAVNPTLSVPVPLVP